LRQAYATLSESERVRFSRAFSPESLEELFFLSQESDLSLFFQGLHSIGLRLNQHRRPELAMLIFSGIAQTLEQDFPGRPADYAALASRARRELDAILGRGAIGARIEHLSRGLAQEASNPVMLASMGMAGLAFSTVRLGMLSRLMSSSGGGIFTRGLGARALASTVGFAAEVPAFVFSGRGLNEALGLHQDWSLNAMGRDLAMAGITLSALKLSGARGTLGADGRNTAFGNYQVAVHGPAMGRIMVGHRMEGFGLRMYRQATFVDSLAAFHVPGRLHHAMRPAPRGRRELETRSGFWHGRRD
jgi:hypothetical protein